MARRPVLVATMIASLLVSLGIASASAGGTRRAGVAASPRLHPVRPLRLASNQVMIVRDAAGIPHITATTLRSLGYGEAWAFAQDNFCTLANDFVTVTAERSKYFGPKALAVNYSAGTANTNLDSDLFWQAVKDSGLYQRESAAPPPIGPLPQVKSLYEGYVAGYNAYLASGQLRDPACAHKSWVRPITLEDMFLRGVQIVTEASSAQFVSDEIAATPPSATASSATAPSAAASSSLSAGAGRVSAALASSRFDPAALRALRESGSSSSGSNGIAIGSKDTQAHDGMVLANPHFPWQGTERFWMVQLTVPGQYAAEGGTLEGFPMIGIGFTSDVAWTHTVSTDFRFTLYQLKLDPGHPTSYMLDGKAVPMGRSTVRVDTGRSIVSHTFYTTRWGTVLDVPQAGYGWSTTTAYAVDDVNLGDEYRSANQYFEMAQATSVRSLLGIEEKYLAIPTFNTIAADSHGNALYADVGNTPNVSAKLIKTCVPPGLPTVVYQVAGVVTLDGSTLKCAWGNAPGTPVKGIFNGSEEPHVIRSDYVENSNDSYWLASPSAPSKAYSPIIGRIDVQQGLRTRIGNLMIAARVSGTDGLGKPLFTIPTLQAMWEGDRSYLAQLVLHSLVGACRAKPEVKASDGKLVNLRSACEVLAHYNGTGKLDAAGGWLFSEWDRSVTSGTFWTKAFSAAHPLTTPSGLDTANPDILQALADAVQSLDANHVALGATYGQVQHVLRDHQVIAIPGCDTGCFNAIYASDGAPTPLAPVGYGQVYDGSSLVMTTELTSSGPVSEGILTYSQSTNPTSKWYANMTKLYSEGKWVPLPWTAAQLDAQPGNQAVVLTVH